MPKFFGVYIKTQVKITLTIYTKPDILTQRLEALPVDRDKNGLLFTELLRRFRL